MIAPGSKSYPFLAIARQFGMDYGIVLAYADAQRKIRRRRSDGPAVRFDVWEREAVRSMSRLREGLVAETIIIAVDEMLRQKGEA